MPHPFLYRSHMQVPEEMASVSPTSPSTFLAAFAGVPSAEAHMASSLAQDQFAHVRDLLTFVLERVKSKRQLSEFEAQCLAYLTEQARTIELDYYVEESRKRAEQMIRELLPIETPLNASLFGGLDEFRQRAVASLADSLQSAGPVAKELEDLRLRSTARDVSSIAELVSTPSRFNSRVLAFVAPSIALTVDTWFYNQLLKRRLQATDLSGIFRIMPVEVLFLLGQLAQKEGPEISGKSIENVLVSVDYLLGFLELKVTIRILAEADIGYQREHGVFGQGREGLRKHRELEQRRLAATVGRVFEMHSRRPFGFPTGKKYDAFFRMQEGISEGFKVFSVPGHAGHASPPTKASKIVAVHKQETT